MPQETQVRQIRIVTDVRGDKDLKSIAQRLGGLNQQLRGVSTAAGLFNISFASLFGLATLRQIVQISDTISLLATRIDVLAGSTEEGAKAFAGLAEVGRRTFSSLSDVATIYSRLAATTGETGITTAKLLDLTQLLRNSFRLSGASAQEAISASIQLSQGFASGELRGQELRSVLESNVVIGNALAKGFGVTRGELLKLAEAGKITTRGALKALFDAQEGINAQAEKLVPTIGDTLRTAFISVQLAVFELNKEYKINERFASAVETITKKLGLALVGVATLAIPFLIVALSKLTVATALATAGLSLIAGAAAIVFFSFDSLDDLIISLTRIWQNFAKAIADVAEIFARSFDFIPNLIGLSSGLGTFFGAISDEARKAEGILNDYANSLERGIRLSGTVSPTDGVKEIEEFFKTEDFNSYLRQFDKAKVTTEQLIGQLNTSFNRGRISFEAYTEALGELELKDLVSDFEKGKISLEKFEEGGAKLKRLRLGREFREGSVSLEEYNNKLRKLEIDEVRNKFNRAKITAQEFRLELSKLQDFDLNNSFLVGIDNYIKSIGTVAEQVSAAVSGAFSTLEDQIFQFTKTGKANFEELTQAILDDIARIVIRSQIVAPLAQALPGIGSALFGPAPTSGAGSVGSVPATLSPFATKLTSSFTGGFAPQSNAARNAGPQMVVNVTNNTNSEIETTERTGSGGEKFLDVLVREKVREGIAAGAFDKPFQQSYGLKRKGF